MDIRLFNRNQKAGLDISHFLLKFNYAVEIGAELAYIGHYKATGDKYILKIANDEKRHQMQLHQILESYGEKPNPILNWIFNRIGGTIGYLCPYTPNYLLNKVAFVLELFAIISYEKLAFIYPDHALILLEMHDNETEHSDYFY